MPTLARLGQVRGLGGIVAMPNRRIGAQSSSLNPTRQSKPFRSRPFSTATIYILGVTRDSTGGPLGGVTVQLFRTLDDSFQGETISDGSGNFSLPASGTGPFYIVAYKAGSPDVAGTSVNTLIPL